MGIGDFLAGAGDVGRGMRSAEQQAQLARMRQLQLQQVNRQQEADRLMTQGGTAGYGAPVGVPSYTMDATNQPAPPVAPGMSRAEMLAEARRSMSPEDLAVAFYSPQPAAPPAWQPAPRGPDGMAAGVTLPGGSAPAPAPAPAAPQQAVAPPPVPEALPGAAGVFRRGADELAAASHPRSGGGQMNRNRQRGSAGVAVPEPVATTTETKVATTETSKRPANDPMKNALRPPASPAGVRAAKAEPAATESPSAFYAGNPQALTSARVSLDEDYSRMRARLLKQAQAFEKVGSGTQMNQVLDQLDMLDQQYRAAARMLEGNNALVMFEFGNDPRALDAILTDYLGGTPVQTQLREDGMNDLIIGDQHRGTYAMGDYTKMVRELFDENFRAATSATKSAVSMLHMENQLAKDLEVTKIQAKALADVALEMTKGSIRFREMEIEGRKFKVAMEPNTNTAVFYSDDGGYLGRLDLNSGVTVDSPAGPLNQAPQLHRANVVK